MQSIYQKLSMKLVSGVFALFVLVAMAVPQANAAAGLTSGGATVHNAVVVTYNSGAATFKAVATVDVTVNTVASLPNITTPTGVTVLPGGTHAYVYRVVSTANGPDTYTPSNPTYTPTGVTGGSITNPAPVTLWGGVVLSSTGAGTPGATGTINVPAGTTGSLVAGTSIINVAGIDYTVTAITPGTVATTDLATGVTTPDSNDVLTLVPVNPASAGVSPATATAGLQVGEVGSFTVTLTAGTPTTPGVDGTPVIGSITVTTGQPGPIVTPGVAPAPLTTAPTTTITTTVSSPKLTITKQARNISVNPAAPFAATGVTGGPGEVLEYQITVTNAHPTATATAVSISDAIPAFTTLLPAQYAGADVQIVSTLGGVAATVNATAAADADVATVTAGVLAVNLGTGATAATAGSLAAGDTVTILYQVTIQ